MFKEKEENNIKNAETIIGPSIKVKGNFFGEGDIIVEGSLEGEIKTNNNLFVGPKALIKANIEAKKAKISGEIKGNITVSESLEITGSAKINGDISAKSISIENGAVFNGFCDMQNNEDKSNKNKDLDKTEK